MKYLLTLVLLIGMMLGSGCATFRSDVTGSDKTFAKPDTGRDAAQKGNQTDVTVLFIFSHYRQTLGYDAIPKLEKEYQIIRGFDDFFQDAMKEFSNVGTYTAYTVFSSDVHDPKRRARKDSLIHHSDYVVRVDILNQDVFSHRILAILGSVVTATLAPMPYTHLYRITVTVENPERQLLGTYIREAHTRKWVEALLIFAYPFHPEKRKVEELYVEMLHDAFRSVEKYRNLTD